MSALTSDNGFQLTTIVTMPRGLTEVEAYDFLETGELPDDNSASSDNNVSLTDDKTAVSPTLSNSDGDSKLLLAGIESFTAAGFEPNQLRNPNTGEWVDESPSGTKTATRADVVTAAASPHKGAMIALIPSDADIERLTVDGGEDSDQLHCTLFYLGQGDDFLPRAREHLVELVRAYVEDLEPVVADGFAISMFNPPGTESDDGKERKSCVVLQLSGGALEHAHNAVSAAIDDYGADLPITAGFDPRQPRDPNTGEWIDTIPDASNAPNLKKVVPASIYKNHANGSIVGVSHDGDQRMRWDSDKKKYITEKRDGDGWKPVGSPLTKKLAYNEFRDDDKWFDPNESDTPKISTPKSSSSSSSSSPSSKAMTPGLSDEVFERAQKMYGNRLPDETDAEWAKRVKARIADIRKYDQDLRIRAATKERIAEENEITKRHQDIMSRAPKLNEDDTKIDVPNVTPVLSDDVFKRAQKMYGDRMLGETDTEWAKRVNARIADIRKYDHDAKINVPSSSSPPVAVLSETSARITALKAAFDTSYTVDDTFTSGNSAGSVERVTLSDGTKGVLKVVMHHNPSGANEIKREVLVGRVANVLGITDVITTDVGDYQVLTTLIDGRTGNRYASDYIASHPKTGDVAWRAIEDEAASLSGGREIGILDWLVNNTDRHAGNWIVRPDGAVRPIDHGNAQFEDTTYPDGKTGKMKTLVPDSPFARYWIGVRSNQYGEFVSIKPLITKSEVADIRARLSLLRDEFAAAGATAWFEYMMNRLNDLEKKAKK